MEDFFFKLLSYKLNAENFNHLANFVLSFVMDNSERTGSLGRSEVKKNRLLNIFCPSYELSLEDYQVFVDGSLKLALKDLYGLCKDIKKKFDDPNDYPSELIETIMDLIDAILHFSIEDHLFPLISIPKYEGNMSTTSEYEEGPVLLSDFFATHSQQKSDVARLYRSTVSRENLAVELAERRERIESKIDGILNTEPKLVFTDEETKKFKVFAQAYELNEVCKHYREIIRRVGQSRRICEGPHTIHANLLAKLERALAILSDDAPIKFDIDHRVEVCIRGEAEDSHDQSDQNQTKGKFRENIYLAYYHSIAESTELKENSSPASVPKNIDVTEEDKTIHTANKVNVSGSDGDGSLEADKKPESAEVESKDSEGKDLAKTISEKKGTERKDESPTSLPSTSHQLVGASNEKDKDDSEKNESDRDDDEDGAGGNKDEKESDQEDLDDEESETNSPAREDQESNKKNESKNPQNPSSRKNKNKKKKKGKGKKHR